MAFAIAHILKTAISHMQKYHGLNLIVCSATLATKNYASEVNILKSIKLHNYATVLFSFFIQAI